MKHLTVVGTFFRIVMTHDDDGHRWEKTQSTHIQSSLVHVRKTLIIHRWQCEHFSSAFRGQQQLDCGAISIFFGWTVTTQKKTNHKTKKKTMARPKEINEGIMEFLFSLCAAWPINQPNEIFKKKNKRNFTIFSIILSYIYIPSTFAWDSHITCLLFLFYFSYEPILTVVPCSMLSFLDLPSIDGERARTHGQVSGGEEPSSTVENGEVATE